MNTRGFVSLAELHVKPLEMFRLQLVNPMGAHPWIQVVVHGDAITDKRIWSYGMGRDVFDPVGEPFLDGPGPSRFPYSAGVAFGFELADGVDDFFFGSAFDVASVGGSVVFGSDGDASVPFAVGAEVNG